MNPPVTLDEVYFSCVNSWGTALFNALGISAGNVQLFLQLFTLFGLPLIFIFFKVLACALYFCILRFVIYITFHILLLCRHSAHWCDSYHKQKGRI